MRAQLLLLLTMVRTASDIVALLCLCNSIHSQCKGRMLLPLAVVTAGGTLAGLLTLLTLRVRCGIPQRKNKDLISLLYQEPTKGQFYNSFEVECTRLKSSAYWLISHGLHKSSNYQSFKSTAYSQGLFQQPVSFGKLFCISEKHAPDGVSTDVNQESFWEIYTTFSTMGHKHMHQSLKHAYEYWLPLASFVTLSDLTFLNLFFICKMGIIPAALQGSKEIKWWNPYNVTNLVTDTQ